MDYERELKELRKKIFLTSVKHGLTHIASAYSCLEILYALYEKKALKYDAYNPEWEERDRFILSKGHAAIGLYAVLEKVGILEVNELDTFLEPGTRLAGEPCKRNLPFIEASTGSLGHGLSLGLGMALAQKRHGIKARTIVLIGDGECQEGSVWEAAMCAVAQNVSNLIAIIDRNKLQKMCSVEETLKVVKWKEKWQAFGWEVVEIDGHNVEVICNELSKDVDNDKPKLIIADTVKGHGVSIMENSPAWHYKEIKKKELKVICEELGIEEEKL